MRDAAAGDRHDDEPKRQVRRRHGLPPIVLWRMHGATDDLRGLVIQTSFGYALGLELDTEMILLHLQPNLESLIAYADRIESALISQGWQVIPETEGRSCH
jgi:hypothetical protein